MNPAAAPTLGPQETYPPGENESLAIVRQGAGWL